MPENSHELIVFYSKTIGITLPRGAFDKAVGVTIRLFALSDGIKRSLLSTEEAGFELK